MFAGTTGKISGNVKSGANGEALIGANVMVEGTPYGAATDLKGNYFILQVPPGNYSVKFAMIGYQTLTVDNVKVRVDLTSSVDAVLNEGTVGLEEVIVQAERPMIQTDVTYSQANISSEEVEMLPVEEFEDILSLQAGVVSSGGEIHVRGGRGGEISYMVDGITVTDPYDSGIAVEIENNAIQELQFISGTFNAEYGQAMSGIVNIVTKDGNSRTEILGCLPNFCDLHHLQVTQGRFLSEEDNERQSEVCVLSANVAQKLFPFGDCVGKTVNVGGNLYVVVGEVGKRMDLNDNDRLGFREEFSDNVYVPIKTVWAKVFDYYYRGYDGSNMYSKVTFTMEDTDKIFAVAELLENILETDHGIKDFQIAVPLELMEQAEKARLTFVALMGIVAAISLLVGGIGIMNIMLATVTERTREIGIRRALGARRRDVTQQFLVETIALTATGGLLGLLAGFLCEPSYSMLLANLESFAPETFASLPAAMKEMTPSLVLWSFPLVFGIAVATGVLFGLYPARKAAAMNPVDALRHVA